MAGAKLRISNELALPLEAVTQTFGVLAKRRAGIQEKGEEEDG